MPDCKTKTDQIDLVPEKGLSNNKDVNLNPPFNEWYERLREQASNKQGHFDAKIHTSKNFTISISGLGIRIDFSKIKLSIYCKQKLKKICGDNIATYTHDAKNDLRMQVILPIADKINDIIESERRRLSETFIGRQHRIDIRSIEPDEIASEIKEYLEDMEMERQRQNTYSALVSQKPYHELFPARDIKRKITLFIAPTNSGKTYKSCQLIKEQLDNDPSANAKCLLPLRALAAQVKDDFMEDGYLCDLITGEEREAEIDSRISSCTTETLDPSVFTDTIFIDECQLIFDDNRQAAYTRAILGAYCENLILAVAPAYADALTSLLKKFTDDEINIVELKRLCPLKTIGKVKASQVQKGDVIVAFRVKTIHQIANYLKQQGLKVGVIYGKMSPSARRAMIREFMAQDCDVLVASDAIGMGISIPAQRVLIAEGTKFDGKKVRPLLDEEIRQVAGRAGRFGFYSIGYAGVFKAPEIIEERNALDPACIERAVKRITTHPHQNTLRVSPDRHVIRSASDLDLSTTLEVWKASVSSHKRIQVAEDTYNDLLDKAVFLDSTEHYDRDLLVDLLFMVFPNDRNGQWFKVYEDLVNLILSSQSIEDYEWSNHVGEDGAYDEISELESESAYLTMISQLQRIAPDLCPHEMEIKTEQTLVGEMLANSLIKKYTPERLQSKSSVYAFKVLQRAKKKLANGFTAEEVEDYIKQSIQTNNHKSEIIKLASSHARHMSPLIHSALAA